MSNNNSSNPKTKYTMLTPEERQLQINKLVDVWKDFVSINDPSLCEDDFFVNERILIEVVERVSKRKYYFEVFMRIFLFSMDVIAKGIQKRLKRQMQRVVRGRLKLLPSTVTAENTHLADRSRCTLKFLRSFEISFKPNTQTILKCRRSLVENPL